MSKPIIIRYDGNNIKQPSITSSFVKLIRLYEKQQIIIILSSITSLENKIEEGIKAMCLSDCDTYLFTSKINDDINQIKTLYDLNDSDFQSLSDKLNILLEGIHLTGDFSRSLKDQVLSYAEKITSSLFVSILTKKGINANLILPENIGLFVTEEYGNASILTEESKNSVISGIKNQISVIPGSYGINKQGKISITGYRSADYTASAISSIFDADCMEIWQTREPFKSANSLYVKNASFISDLSYDEASELSYFNSSIYPRMVEPLIQKHIAVFIYDIENGEKKLRTKINSNIVVAPKIIKSVVCSDDIAVLNLNGPGVGFKPGILAKVTGAFNRRHLNIRSVITAQTSINIIINKKDISEVRLLVKELDLKSVRQTEIEENLSMIAVVGQGIQSNHEISAQLFTAIAKIKINVILSGSGASNLVSYLLVDEKNKIKAIREIHKVFIETETNKNK
ncbi:MAG: aspartate kinase [Prolixibacteraceae bacterium]|nr:aspartate kinase [Prolixibacteraceae bacterium]